MTLTSHDDSTFSTDSPAHALNQESLRVIVDQNLIVLSVAAVSIALVHTLCGPDHYVPFVAMSRAGEWSLRKTMMVTLIAGLGHVGGSVLLGFMGMGLGILLSYLQIVEELRDKTAGWCLIMFGFGYLAWGLVYGRHQRSHLHRTGHHHSETAHQSHDVGTIDDSSHHHTSHATSDHADDRRRTTASLTPWILLTIFIFGPCEPLIPLLMYPAAQSSFGRVILVTMLFGITTIVTMMTMVFCLVQGTTVFRIPALHRYTHALAGTMVMLCGIAINFGL